MARSGCCATGTGSCVTTEKHSCLRRLDACRRTLAFTSVRTAIIVGGSVLATVQVQVATAALSTLSWRTPPEPAVLAKPCMSTRLLIGFRNRTALVRHNAPYVILWLGPAAVIPSLKSNWLCTDRSGKACYTVRLSSVRQTISNAAQGASPHRF